MPKGVYARKPRAITAIKAVALCRGCDWSWKPLSGFACEPCPKCGVVRDVRRREHKSSPESVARLRQWRAGRPEYSTKASRQTRRTAVRLVGRGIVSCIRCGCDKPELLEINHKNGGGQADLRGRSQQFYRDIAMHRRDVDDLELLCKPCNAIHALELVHGPLPFSVTWGGK